MIDEPDRDPGDLPPRLSDGRLVPVGLCPVRVAREKARRARWGARAVPGHGHAPKAKSAKDRGTT